MTHPIHTDNAERKHELKTDPAVFEAVARGDKTHEIRLNDRNFQVGDKLLLRETESTGAAMRNAPKLHPLVYTGRVATRIVSHIQTGYGLADGWCILSFRAAAQVGANGAAPVISDDEIFGAWDMAAMNSPITKSTRVAFAREVERIILSRLAAGAPAETPKPVRDMKRLLANLHDAEYVTSYVGALWRMIEEGDEALERAATIGAGEGKDALDAARWRFMMRVSDDENGPESVAMEAFADEMFSTDRPKSEQLSGLIDRAAAIDAAMRSKTSPGEAG